MFTSRIVRLTTFAGFIALTAGSYAAPVLGCGGANRTSVDCATILSAQSTAHGVSFYTATEYHVGYRKDEIDAAGFIGAPMNIGVDSTFVTPVAELDNAVPAVHVVELEAVGFELGGGTTAIEFDAEDSFADLVLSGLTSTEGRSSQEDPAETAEIPESRASDEKVAEQPAAAEGDQEYVHVDFGNVVPEINPLLVSSGGGLPGLESGNTNIPYITQISEPGAALLGLTGLVFLALRRRFTIA